MLTVAPRTNFFKNPLYLRPWRCAKSDKTGDPNPMSKTKQNCKNMGKLDENAEKGEN